MGLSVERIEILLLIAAIVAMLARKVRLPYTVGLVVTGVVLAFSGIAPHIQLTKELIFTAFLPPLVFEAAFHILWRELRRDLPVVLTLATVGVLLSASLTAVGMWYFAGWEWTAALLFGVLIAATDPVSVIATFKEAGVEGRLKLLVEAESLLNDGTAAVAFGVVLSATNGAAINGLSIVQSFVITVFGGILCGVLVGSGVLILMGRTEDPLVEITFTTVAAYGSFLLAEHFHFSGVLSTLTAGLLVGNIGPLGAISSKGHEAVVSFWEYMAFVANSLIFLLLGIREAQEKFLTMLTPAVVAIILVLLGRMVAVYSCCALFSCSNQRVEWRYQHILVWGGLRGALALALALGLPSEIPHCPAIQTVAFAVVAFSVVVQGLTITPLLRKTGAITN